MVMERNTAKKTGVIIVAVVMILLFISIPTAYLMTDVPPIAVAAAAVVYVALAIGVAYYAHERLNEIEEGLDDAVDDY